MSHPSEGTAGEGAVAAERWSLSEAVDALSAAARAAGRPGSVWIAGLFYPTVCLGLGTGWAGQLLVALDVSDWTDGRAGSLPLGTEGLFGTLLVETLGGALVLAPLLLIMFRWIVGLARLAPPRVWDEARGARPGPGLRRVWRAGKGLTWSALGMWLMLAAMVFGASLLALLALRLATAVGGGSFGSPSWGLGLVIAVPVVALLALYATVVSVIHQLALHSLAHNRRGVASALVHAWRLARNDPRATVRAVVVDLVLYVCVVAVAVAVARGLTAASLGGSAVALVVPLALSGFMGVTRAGYWARAYRALGGLSPDDGVPGLAPGAGSAAEAPAGAAPAP